MLSESKYLVDFLVGFSGKKPQTLLIPIYSTTVLYDYMTAAADCCCYLLLLLAAVYCFHPLSHLLHPILYFIELCVGEIKGKSVL